MIESFSIVGCGAKINKLPINSEFILERVNGMCLDESGQSNFILPRFLLISDQGTFANDVFKASTFYRIFLKCWAHQ